jgi:N4-gp56 family major capsid protein
MAGTSYGVNDALAVKLWSKSLSVEALKKTYIFKFIGSGADSLIQTKSETSKGPGDKVTFGLRMQASGDGVQGDGILEGNEESLTTYSDSIFIDQLRHAHRVGGRMSEQRVPFDVRRECRDSLSDWFANRMDTSFANQIAGNTGQADTRYTGNNAAVAPSSTRIVYPNASRNTEDLINSSDTFTLTQIDKAVEKARTASPMIRPLKVDGEDMYVCFLHDYQVTSLRTNTSTGQWFDIQKAALSAKGDSKNPIFTGALGVYNGVVLHRWNRIPVAPSSSAAGAGKVRRAVLCGAQAAQIAFGQENGPSKFTWTEKMFDYDNQFGVAAGTIFGLKKTVFNSVDFGTVLMPSYADAAV